MSPLTLPALEAALAERAQASPETSYTARLVADPARAAKKLGEEAVEAAIAAAAGDRDALVGEAADVLYHLLAVLLSRGVRLEEVMAELARRQGTSGLAEKAARSAEGARSDDGGRP